MSQITEIEKILARSRAEAHLSRSIMGLCLCLGVDVDSVTSAIEIPVDNNDHSYYAYVSLKAQLLALEKILEAI